MASTGYRAALVPAADQSRAGIPRTKKPAPTAQAGFSGGAPKGGSSAKPGTEGRPDAGKEKLR